MPLTADRTYVPSERSGLPTIAIIGAINCRDVAIVTGNSAAPVLAKDRHKKGHNEPTRIFVVAVSCCKDWLLRLDSNPLSAALRGQASNPPVNSRKKKR